jgi:hypothetical protein
MIETVGKVAMGACLLAAIPIQDPGVEAWANWGLAGIVVAYVLVRDHQRERRLASAIEQQQRWIRETLLTALESNAKAMDRMSTWLEKNGERRGFYR